MAETICPTHGAGYGTPCYLCVDADNRVLRARVAALERELDEARKELTDRIASIMHNPDVDGTSLAAGLIREGRERERVEVAARIATLEAALASADPWARFGDVVFERFWSDGQPGDLEGGDLQEIARDCGLLGRTAEVDAGATHAEGCDWEPWMSLDECDCWAPMLGPYRSALRGEEGTDA